MTTFFSIALSVLAIGILLVVTCIIMLCVSMMMQAREGRKMGARVVSVKDGIYVVEVPGTGLFSMEREWPWGRVVFTADGSEVDDDPVLCAVDLAVRTYDKEWDARCAAREREQQVATHMRVISDVADHRSKKSHTY